MASIRVNLMLALRDRINAITGIACGLRDTENELASSPVVVILFPDGENKNIATSEQYQSNYRLEALIVCRPEDADPTIDEGNAYLYLDRNIVLVEKVVHSPDEWGDVDVTDVQITGHTIEDPGDGTEIAARLFIEFDYRHNYQDPEA